jgi:D-tyrosyl-tRNA(Tyr) deacylase
MRAVVQRTTGSQVAIKGMVKASIDKGLMVLLGIEKGDREADARFLMDKLGGLRIFEDDQGKMNLSVKDVQGAILLVSQFILPSTCSHLFHHLNRKCGFELTNCNY